jgi:hypothetical protein
MPFANGQHIPAMLLWKTERTVHESEQSWNWLGERRVGFEVVVANSERHETQARGLTRVAPDGR